MRENAECWIFGGPGLFATAAGALVGAAIADQQRQFASFNHVMRGAARGALVGVTAPLSLPILVPYYAFVRRVNKEGSRCC